MKTGYTQIGESNGGMPMGGSLEMSSTNIPIEVAPTADSTGVVMTAGHYQSKSKSALPVSLTTMALAAAAFVVTLLFGQLLMTSEAPPTMGGAKARPCTFDECQQSGCDATINPDLCVDPDGPFYGCSPEPWTDADCAESCSLEECSEQTAGKDDETCKGTKCPTERCSTTYQLCGSDQPYQCLSGSSAMGCSDDQYGWPLVSDTICGECCDTRMC